MAIKESKEALSDKDIKGASGGTVVYDKDATFQPWDVYDNRGKKVKSFKNRADAIAYNDEKGYNKKLDVVELIDAPEGYEVITT
ncbi:MAG: hypothetical protein LBJ95_05025 [Oscillospiraceae bacterium]|nr:hypothetical protein [Oscillospiraceae bacterium]